MSELAIFEAVIIAALGGYFLWRQVVWDRREHELLDRLAARDLWELEAHRKPAEPAPVIEPDEAEECTDPDAMTMEQFTDEMALAESLEVRVLGSKL